MSDETEEVTPIQASRAECNRLAQLLKEASPGNGFVLMTSTPDGPRMHFNFAVGGPEALASMLLSLVAQWQASLALDAGSVEPTAETVGMMRSAVAGRFRGLAWSQLLLEASAGIRNVEISRQFGQLDAAKAEALKAATLLLAAFDQLQRPLAWNHARLDT